MLVGSSESAAVYNTPAQARTQFTLWCMMSAPLLIGSSILNMVRCIAAGAAVVQPKTFLKARCCRRCFSRHVCRASESFRFFSCAFDGLLCCLLSVGCIACSRRGTSRRTPTQRLSLWTRTPSGVACVHALRHCVLWCEHSMVVCFDCECAAFRARRCSTTAR
jgi:hypothetical protein